MKRRLYVGVWCLAITGMGIGLGVIYELLDDAGYGWIGLPIAVGGALVISLILVRISDLMVKIRNKKE